MIDMSVNQEKFQILLRELFQFDCADLDFGIYRIMNYKRDVVEKFITEDLPKAVFGELDRGALADQSRATKELKEITKRISEDFGKDALDADGNLAEAYRETPLGKKYMDLKARAGGGRGREALEAAIFNHLHTFFSRYYQEGDFISKRRYSKRQKYAIPYNGEEVHLYWANNDQYYIKTAEHFNRYAFTSKGVTVRFEIQAADVEQNNVKGDKRFFLPRCKDIVWDEKAGLLVILFEYRPLTEQEEIAYGKRNQQEAISTRALEDIFKQLKKADKAMLAVTAERHKDSDGKGVTFLEHHLKQYTRSNTSDFFIHKDLKGFLSRELDFYLKNEVLNLDEMEAAGEGRTEGWFQVMRVIKAVGAHIIDFLAQVENFQKMLWEKRKFITESQYCITVNNINKGFYHEIADCEAQWAEWKELFHIDEEQADLFTTGKSRKDKRVAFLEAHPTLVLDTKHFGQDFVDRLLAGFENLDEMTDGLLVHSENFQALNLLLGKYRSKIAYSYIDPPYNTASSEIIYKNDYKNSSWLSLIENRLSLARHLLIPTGLFSVAIDDCEVANLLKLTETVFQGSDLYPVIIEYNHRGRTRNNFSLTHEYCIWAVPQGSDLVTRQTTISPDIKRNLRRTGQGSLRHEAPKQFFGIEVDNKTLEVVNVTEAIPLGKSIPKHNNPDTVMVWPIDSDGRERRWYYGRDRVLRGVKEGTVYAKRINGAVQIHYWEEGGAARRKSVWVGKKYDASTFGSELLNSLFGRSDFTFPKSVHALEDCVEAGCNTAGGWVLDFFAGSGTTGHAILNLWRQRDVARKFLLVEMGDYYDTILLPRIKKVTFSPEWKNGKPKRMATKEEAERSPRIVKYIRLESYEDALNNIQFDASGQAGLEFDDYLLKYMLHWEARKSETLLNVEKLASPFSYTLHIHRDGRTTKKTVDIPETFNYLLGLHVSRRQVVHDKDRRYLVYRGRIDHREIVVIWRETDGWTKKDLEQDKKFVATQKLTEGADEVFVNGDSFIPDARALEPLFKSRMFSPVEA